MKKELTAYMQKTDTIIQEEKLDSDWSGICREHEIHIRFYQHERLVHLLVTMTFALLAFASIWLLYFAFSIAALLLTLLLFCLLIPYISHYYFLENGVQKLYLQYDRLTQIRDSQTREANQN